MMVGTGIILILSVFEDINSQESLNVSLSLSSLISLLNTYSIQCTLFGLIFGWGIVWLSSVIITSCFPDISFLHLKGQSASQVLVVLLTMTLHSLGEGSSIGIAAGTENSDLSFHVIVSLAIHNIPEGLATCLYLVSRGMNKKQACIWSILCDVPLPLTAVPAFLFVEQFKLLLNASLGFAAGAMFYVSFMELLPECLILLEKERIKNNAENKGSKSKRGEQTAMQQKMILFLIFGLSTAFVFVIN